MEVLRNTVLGATGGPVSVMTHTRHCQAAAHADSSCWPYSYVMRTTVGLQETEVLA